MYESHTAATGTAPSSTLLATPAAQQVGGPRVQSQLETEIATMRVAGAGAGPDPIPINNMTRPEAVATTLCDVCLPPLGVYMSTGSGRETLVNVLLFLLGYFPGVVHSLAVTYSPFSFTGVKARAAAQQAGLGASTTTTVTTSAGGPGGAPAYGAAGSSPPVVSAVAAPVQKAVY